MVKRICPKCNLEFIRKSTYDNHINRKTSCIQLCNNDLDLNPKDSKLNPKLNPILNLDIKSTYSKKYKCLYCLHSFSTNSNMNKHINNICKKKETNIIIEQKQIYYDKELNEIKMQLKKIKDENTKLKNQMKKNKSNININNNNVNINIVNNIINFNDMNLNLNTIDKKLFVNPIMDRRLFGKAIILKMIENIYINESLPEYQNIVITDKNRGYVKVYNDGKWKTNNLETINLVLNGIIEHSKLILDELYKIYLNNNKAINRLNTSDKYIKYCDLEHLEELKDQQENELIDNTNEIKRCEEFREMIFKDTINLFHDNKNILLKPKNIKLLDI